MTTIPADMQDAYATNLARFYELRPDLEGLTPSCAHCALRDDALCTVSGEIRRRNADCNTGAFVYDERPLWEQFPHISKREWERPDGMLADSMRRIEEYVAKGGSIDDLPTLRTGGVRLVFPPQKRRDEFALPEEAWSEDGYQEHDLTAALRDRQAVREQQVAA